jgi:hypothetical protein
LAEKEASKLRGEGQWFMNSSSIHTGAVSYITYCSEINVLVWGTTDGFISTFEMQGGME